MRLRNFARTLLCAGVLGIALSSPALAQPAASSAASADLSAQATQLYNEGAAAAKLGQWDKARTFYLSAWRVQPHWQIAASLGRAELKASKFRDAAEHLTYFLHEAPKIEPEDRKRTEELLEQAKAKVGALAISVSQEGAEIRIDMAPVGKTPLKNEVFVEPGRHVVEARLDGYGPMQATVVVHAGSQVPVNLTLAKVEVQGPPTGPVGPVGPAIPGPGPDAGPNKTVVLAGAVAAGVMAVAGVGFHLGAHFQRVKRDEEGDRCISAGQSACPAFDKAEGARVPFAIVAITSYVAAGVLGVGTLSYVLAKRPGKPQQTATATFAVGPGAAGAMVTVPW